MLHWENPSEIGQWIQAHGGGFLAPGTFTAIGYTQHGELVGGIAFANSNGKHCLVNIALKGRTFPRPLLLAALWYVFIQLTLRRVTFIIEQDNLRSQNLVTRLGAKREATLRDAGKSGDLFIYSLFPEDCVIWSRLRERYVRPASPESRSNNPPTRGGESENLRLPARADADEYVRPLWKSDVVENSHL
jgi:RimJ/RimL family protein N-acetyltransferase